MAKSILFSAREAIAEGLWDKRVWEAAEEVDKDLEAFLHAEEDDGDGKDQCADRCDWCGQSTDLCGELVSARDADEGMHGPVYRVCRKCDGKQQAALQAEFDRTMLDMDNRSFIRP